IDQILYNEENNALLRKADEYKAEIERLNKSISGEGAYLREAIALLRFTGKSGMLTAFDDELFTQTVEKIVIESRNVFVFRLKCGLSLKERM
ncbi:MAG: recombinase family protein, partial [Clostridia bacterium]|nr:recombinase family protein [Clostridia bacterium]